MVPMNLLRGKTGADYVNTGEWSKKAIKEAKQLLHGQRRRHAPRTSNFTYVPAQASWKLDPDAAYVHYTPNETIGGVEFHCDAGHRRRAAGGRHVVAPSCRGRSTSRKFGVIYAGAQKNIGPAGLDHRHRARGPARPGARRARRRCSTTRRRPTTARCYNTPPTYAMLHRRAGVPVAASAGRPRRRWSSATVAKAEAALRLPSTRPASTRNPVAKRRTARG
ncbi:MAG: aminotransferase class V-fold PLP-dependent enzyme [Chromatiales bacterium]|nr:aminotransferase class V-fold PLP-dependent enzyme [Chromatiales bacterium]